MTPSAEVFWHEAAGMWWPVADGDPHKAWAFVQRYAADSDETVKLCARRRTCVQAGGYVGLWPARLAKSFDRVLTFEVMPGCYEACGRNCEALKNVTVEPFGLGAVHGQVPLRPHGTAGSWRIDPEGEMTAELITIDSIGLTDCDAIILDIEGYEVEALKGAAATIKRCRPVIHVEELERSKAGIQAHMRSIGYVVRKKLGRDVIYTHA